MSIERNVEHEVKITIPSQDIVLDGNLYVPENAKGIVAFVHGSGSSRFSPRNRFVAKYINKGGFATLLFDLLTRSEEARDLITADLRFDIDLLSKRLSGTTEWLFNNPETREFQIGYFGASTGAAAALVSSVGRKNVKAVVSRGGRPDMAGEALAKISAPTLLIVGGEDDIVIELNNRAYDILNVQAKRMNWHLTGFQNIYHENHQYLYIISALSNLCIGVSCHSGSVSLPYKGHWIQLCFFFSDY